MFPFGGYWSTRLRIRHETLISDLISSRIVPISPILISVRVCSIPTTTSSATVVGFIVSITTAIIGIGFQLDVGRGGARREVWGRGRVRKLGRGYVRYPDIYALAATAYLGRRLDFYSP
eukprot:GHVO01034579.1.p1 GENE.GHVO01034579.1~~GHVO01034579.1.p1  ORF type:complete len:119 (+),score=1.10 GHVO01034579.1:232-588(+)